MERILPTKKHHKKVFIKISSYYVKQILETIGKTKKRNASEWEPHTEMPHGVANEAPRRGSTTCGHKHFNGLVLKTQTFQEWLSLWIMERFKPYISLASLQISFTYWENFIRHSFTYFMSPLEAFGPLENTSRDNLLHR